MAEAAAKAIMPVRAVDTEVSPEKNQEGDGLQKKRIHAVALQHVIV